jgi:small GTP-binding protein
MPNQNLLLFGIDRAGKTALACVIASTEVNKNLTPTLGVNVSNLILRDLKFKVYDVPGQKSLRVTWEKASMMCGIFIFVLDTSDSARFDEAFEEFGNLIKSPTAKGKPILVCFNKMDLPESKNNLAVAKEKLNTITKEGIQIKIFETSVLNPASIAPLKEELVQLIQSSRWN